MGHLILIVRCQTRVGCKYVRVPGHLLPLFSGIILSQRGPRCTSLIGLGEITSTRLLDCCWFFFRGRWWEGIRSVSGQVWEPSVGRGGAADLAADIYPRELRVSPRPAGAAHPRPLPAASLPEQRGFRRAWRRGWWGCPHRPRPAGAPASAAFWGLVSFSTSSAPSFPLPFAFLTPVPRVFPLPGSFCLHGNTKGRCQPGWRSLFPH